MKRPAPVLSFLILPFLLLSGAAQAQQSGTLEKVQKSGEIAMGVRESSAPLSYTLGAGEFTGYHVELCRAIVERMGKSLGREIKVNYQPVTSQNRISLVQNGTVDLECGSTTNNETRQKDVAFGLTTYVTEVRTAVKVKSGISSIAQLNRKTVVTTTEIGRAHV